VQDHGVQALLGFSENYPALHPIRFEAERLDLSRALANADLVIVHEWNEPELVRRIGEHHAQSPHYTLFFHDTHHRSVTAPEEMARYDLSHYDAVLAFGAVVRDVYLAKGWSRRAFTWHEAADVRKFCPRVGTVKRGDLVWIGNFGDDERTAELCEFLIEPAKTLGIKATVYGVRYPAKALELLEAAGIEYGGYLPNWEVPRVFAENRITIHVPRRPYASQLPGIPTIRPFEAMACGIALVSAPWSDREGLFTAGSDYRVAHDGSEMRRAIAHLLSRPNEASAMAKRARFTIEARHTCAHRVQQLFDLHRLVATERVSSTLPTQRSSHGTPHELNG
jgi:spore maturation protein CgeB